MVEIISLDDVPIRVLEVLKIFLAASSRGEKACLVLETQSKMVNTKYRSVETRAGLPATETNTSMRRRKTPARARRSQLRLEEFTRKKLEEKAKLENQQTLDTTAAGITSSNANILVLELPKKEMVVDTGTGTSSSSPIAQLDGGFDSDDQVLDRYSFESTYHEDDINELLSELFLESDVNFTLESRVKVAPRSANEVYVIALRPTGTMKQMAWPDMKNEHADVFQNVKRLK